MISNGQNSISSNAVSSIRHKYKLAASLRVISFNHNAQQFILTGQNQWD